MIFFDQNCVSEWISCCFRQPFVRIKKPLDDHACEGITSVLVLAWMLHLLRYFLNFSFFMTLYQKERFYHLYPEIRFANYWLLLEGSIHEEYPSQMQRWVLYYDDLGFANAKMKGDQISSSYFYLIDLILKFSFANLLIVKTRRKRQLKGAVGTL